MRSIRRKLLVRVWVWVGVVAALWPLSASAGMAGAPTLTELAKFRVEAISFFLAVILVSAAGIRGIWNHLRKSFVRLPRLTYGKALGLVLLWGLLFLVVLVMVGAARELMTPGAWERDGALYKLRERGR
jgi:uncharacterized membrane protein